MSENPVAGKDLASAGLTALETRPAGSLVDDTASQGDHSSNDDEPAAKGWRFWAIFPPLCLSSLLVALESTVTSTALPMITADLNSGDNYVWFLNGYLLTS